MWSTGSVDTKHLPKQMPTKGKDTANLTVSSYGLIVEANAWRKVRSALYCTPTSQLNIPVHEHEPTGRSHDPS